MIINFLWSELQKQPEYLSIWHYKVKQRGFLESYAHPREESMQLFSSFLVHLKTPTEFNTYIWIHRESFIGPLQVKHIMKW